MLARVQNDRRGMILVIAIPMMAILVGALWYLATVGDAVLFRERLQDAADATAFEDAVIHARGMNAVAMLNMIMAMLLCIVVIIRALELVLAVGLIFFGATAGPLTSVVNIDLQWSDRIGKVVGVLSKVEKGVAGATPALSTLMSAAHNSSFYRSQEAANGAVAFSYALMPAKLDDYLKVSPQSWLLSRGKQPGPGRLATKLAANKAMEFVPSLPLEEDEYEKVCAKAISFLPDQVVGLAERHLGLPGVVGWAFRKAVQKTSDALAEYTSSIFCGSPIGAVTKLIGDAAGSVCDGELPADAQSEEDVRAEHGDAGPPLPPGKDGGTRSPSTAPQKTPTGKRPAGQSVADCKAQVKQKLSKAAADPDEQRPARVWTPAVNGNVLMQTWAVASSSGPKFSREDARGMELMAKGKNAGIVADPMAWAQAEYYFDCSGRDAEWRSCKDNAMWALGWTARMRRFWWPMKELDRAADTYGLFMQVLPRLNNIIRNGLSDFGGGLGSDVVQGINTGLLTQDLMQSMNRSNAEWIH